MIQLLIIADDLTGALDTGVQLSKAGFCTKVTTNCADLFRELPQEADVLVADTETRHLPADEAYRRVRGLAEDAYRHGVPHFYKKVDSALRGNIGSELAALRDACGGSPLVFIPAYPAAGRTTKDGVHYVEGVPVNRSAFGADPFEPVRHSAVADIIAEQTDLPVALSGPRLPRISGQGITVVDAAVEEDLDTVRDALEHVDFPVLLAGCAGFASRLPAMLSVPPARKPSAPAPDRALVLSGSVNPLAFRQHAYARAHGVRGIELTPRQKLIPLADDSLLLGEMEAAMADRGTVLVSAADSRESVEANDRYAASLGLESQEIRTRVAHALGGIGAAYSRAHPETLMFLIGGDTLVSYLEQMGVHDILLHRELLPGVVYSTVSCAAGSRSLISKSGGLGREDAICEALKVLVARGV